VGEEDEIEHSEAVFQDRGRRKKVRLVGVSFYVERGKKLTGSGVGTEGFLLKTYLRGFPNFHVEESCGALSLRLTGEEFAQGKEAGGSIGTDNRSCFVRRPE